MRVVCEVNQRAKTRMKRLASAYLFLTASIVGYSEHSLAAEPEARARALMSLEQLVNQEVTSVSKQEEKASQASAAVYVITAEDIRRSGATSIPEALRMAPGISVARAGSSGWAVTSRGFNDEFANKMLVMIDGRSVYNPLFAGVYWDVQNVPLENIDRIEVIRGPAGTLWGANAVNGVINIITKPAEATQDGLQETLIGNRDVATTLRYGGKIGDSGHWRAYAMHQRWDEELDLTGHGINDDWKVLQGGFRTELALNDRDSLSMQGDYYEGDENFNRAIPSLAPPFVAMRDTNVALQGGNLMMRWDREFSKDSRMHLKAYYDHTRRMRELIGEHQDRTYDVEFQHSFLPMEGNEMVWGLGYRLIDDNLDSSPYSLYQPSSRQMQLFSAFVQDKIALVDDEVFLTLGSKFEHNSFTGFEYQPSARLSWLVDENNTLWLAISRAIRSPNRSTDDTNLVIGVVPGAGYVALAGDRSAESEELLAYEAGFRSRLSKDFAIDIAAYFNDYDGLLSSRRGTPYLSTQIGTPPPSVIFPLLPTNAVDGYVYGAETTANWQVMDNWSLAASYSYLNMNLSGLTATSLLTQEGTTPHHQFNIRSNVNLTDNLEFDTLLYFNDNLPAEGIDAYTRLDLRLGWRPVEPVEVSLAAQNITDDQHPEFSAFTYNNPAQIGRVLYGKISWKF